MREILCKFLDLHELETAIDLKQIIPKTIHYCWFGGRPLPAVAEHCMKSWRELLPDYTIKRWDETNTDIHENRYAREAYEAGKYAFVSDYMRLKVLYEEGGIYMDTDVEVVKNLDSFLGHRAFSGFESPNLIPTGIMGAEQCHPWIGSLLECYRDKSFFEEDGTYDMTPNTVLITQLSLKQGLRLTNKKQIFHDVVMYPKEVFCPKDYDDSRYFVTENTYTIHHFSGSWYTSTTRWLMRVRIHFIKRYLPWLDSPLNALYHRLKS